MQWAHYQLVDAIKKQDAEVIKLFVEAGMVLSSKDVIIGQMIENPDKWISLMQILQLDTEEGLSGLFQVPRYLTDLDKHFKEVETRYAEPHTIAFKDKRLAYNKIFDKWVEEKNLELANVDKMCDGDNRCMIKNIPSIHVEYDKKKPIAPEKDLILWQKPRLSLMSAAILLDEQDIINYLKQKGVTTTINKMVMSDLATVIFEVKPDKSISYPEGITVK